MKKLIYTILISLVVVFTGCLDMPDMDHDLDTAAPFVTTVNLNGSTLLNISPEDNVDTNFIKNTQVSVREKQENKVDYASKFFISFSEPVHFNSVQEFGKSDTVVLIEADHFSRSFLNDINSAPLSDTNSAKKLPIEISEVPNSNGQSIVVKVRQYQYDDEGDVLRDKYGQIKYNPLLKYGTQYALIVSQDVVDLNGKGLTVRYEDLVNNKVITTQDSFVLLFETEPLPIKLTSTTPVAAPKQGTLGETAYNQILELYKTSSAACPNLKEIEIYFDDEMDGETINSQSLTIQPAVAGTVSYETVSEILNEGKDNEETIDHYVAKIVLSANMNLSTEYTVTLKNSIRSKRGASLSIKNGDQYLVADGTFTFWTDDELITGAPQFVNGTDVTSTVVGNVIRLNWSTQNSSAAEVKFKDNQGNESYNTIAMTHEFSTEALSAGTYTFEVTPLNPCDDTRGTTKTVSATIQSHPIITEASPNANILEFVELYNFGNTALDLSQYKLDIGGDVMDMIEHNGGGTMLSPGDYAVVVETGYDGSLPIAGGALTVEVSNVDMTKSEDVTLTYNGNTVSSYTYDFIAAASSNYTAQRVSLTSEDFCESTGTPGAPNVCQ